MAIDENLYTALDRVRGILQTYLDDVVTQAAGSDPARIALIRSMLKLMIQTSGTRKFVSLPELTTGIPDVSPADIERLTRKLQDDRVIEPRGQAQQASYSLSHEFMVAKVQSWYDERELERRKAQETLERGLAEWKSSQALLNEKQVAHIRTRLGGEGLSAQAEQLLTQSQQVYAERKRKEEEQERRIRLGKKILWGVIAVALIVALGLTGWALRERMTAFQQARIAQDNAIKAQAQEQEAKKQTGIAQANEAEAKKQKEEADRRAWLSLAQTLNVQALNQRVSNPPLGLLLAKQAYFIHQQNHGAMLDQMTQTIEQVLEPFIGPGQTFQHPTAVSAVAFSFDGKFLISADQDGNVRLWDWSQPTAQPTVLAVGYAPEATQMEFSHDGRYLLYIDGEEKARKWDREQPTIAPTIPPEQDKKQIRLGPMSPHGQFSVSNGDVWDRVKSTAIAHIGETEDVTFVAFSPDDNWLAIVERGSLETDLELDGSYSANNNVTIRLWEVATLPPVGSIQATPEPHILKRFTGRGNAVAFSRDGKLFAAAVTVENDLSSRSPANLVWVWDLTQPAAEPRILSGHHDEVTSVAFSPDGTRLATGSRDHTARVWDLTQPATPQVFSGINDTVASVAFHPDGQFIAFCGQEIGMWTWDWRRLTAEPPVLFDDGLCSSVAFSPDGKFLAAASNFNVLMWDLSMTLNPHLTPPPEPLYLDSEEFESQPVAMAFHPDSKRLAAVDMLSTTNLWDLTRQDSTPRVLPGQETSGWPSIAFSPNGAYLAIWTDGTIRLWDVNRPTAEPRVLSRPQTDLTSVAFCPNAQFLVTGSTDATLSLWDLTQPPTAVPRTLAQCQGSVSTLAFSPNGQFLAAGCSDFNIWVWDVSTVCNPGMTQPAVLHNVITGHRNWVRSMAFSPDSQFLVSGSDDKTVRISRVINPTYEMFCDLAGRNLSWSEWQQFIGSDIPYERTCDQLPVNIRADAQDLAQYGQIEKARYAFQRLLELDPNSPDPTTEANRWRAQRLIVEGQAFARDGDIEQAIDKFQQALKLDSTLTFDPKTEANRWHAQQFFEASISKRRIPIKEILDAYKEIWKLDPDLDPATLNVTPTDWNEFCWRGSLSSAAAAVLDACDQAVHGARSAKEQALYRDSRGLARALTGNFTGAIEDFQAYVEWKQDDEEAKTQRQQWIEALKKGENPFTPEVLEGLK